MPNWIGWDDSRPDADSDYFELHEWACEYATRSSAASIHNCWGDCYLAGLFRAGLQLTTNEAWLMMPDTRYGPSGKPMRAPLVPSNEKRIWPDETYIIYRT